MPDRDRPVAYAPAAPGKRPVGYEIPATYWCLRCAPEGLESSDPVTEDEALGIPYTCEGCGQEMTPEKWEADDAG